MRKNALILKESSQISDTVTMNFNPFDLDDFLYYTENVLTFNTGP
jgi:hypothetical protein